MVQFTAKDALRWALKIEMNGMAFYNKVAQDAAHPDAKLLFEDLAEQEQRHYRTFRRMLDKTPADEIVDPTATAQAQAFLEDIYSSALLSDDSGMALAERARHEIDAVKAAIAFEKDTLLFFHELRDTVTADAYETVTAIIDEEKEHLRQLGRVLKDLPWVA